MNKMTTNNISLVGRVGKINAVEGKDMLFVNLAVNRSYKSGNGKKEKETDWHDVVFYGKLKGVVEQYVGVGDKILIIGSMEMWENNKLIVRADHFNFDTGTHLNIIGNLVDKKMDEYLVMVINVDRKIKNDNDGYNLKSDNYNVRVYNKELALLLDKEIPIGTNLLINGELHSDVIKDNEKQFYIRARKVNLI